MQDVISNCGRSPHKVQGQFHFAETVCTLCGVFLQFAESARTKSKVLLQFENGSAQSAE